MPDTLSLLVNGQRYDGWKSIEVTRGLDSMTGSFELGVSEKWPNHPEAWAIQCGDACRVMIGSDLVLTGWVDETDPDFEAESHTVNLRGRGRAGDLVDCSAMNEPGKWSGRKLEQIAADLAKPFGIKVVAKTDTGAPFKAFALQQGETVKDAIDRMLLQRGLLAVENAKGELEILAPGKTRAGGRLTLGGNVTVARGHNSMLERFSNYTVKGQRQGDDDDNGKAVAQVMSRAADPAVKRYRPLIIMAEDQADGGSAKNRAALEATTRAAKAQKPDFTVRGWRDPSGALWTPGLIIGVDAKGIGVTGDLLISEVKFKLDESGTTTELTVVRPEAYSRDAIEGGQAGQLSGGGAGADGAGGKKKKKGKKGKKGKGGGLDAIKDLLGGGGGE